MEGNIFINGLIGSFGSEIGTELIDIIQQVKKQEEAQSFKVHINSEGGAVDVGFDIYNYLKSLNKPIKTVGSGRVMSIATVIFMAGDDRIIKEGTEFMIHLPWGGIDGTAEEIEAYSKEVKSVEDKLIKFYTEVTNTSKEAVYPLLRNETYLNYEQAKDLGFTTSEYLPVAARAYFNSNTNKSMNNLKEEDKSWLEDQFNKITNIFNSKKKEVKNLMLQDANGATLDFPDVAEDAMPQVGDVATLDGDPAEGDYIMPNGETYVFAAGELTEIIAADVDDEDVEALKSENESLKEQLEALNAEKEALNIELASSKETLEEAEKEVLALKKNVKSKFDIDIKVEKKEIKEENNISEAKKALARLKEKRK